MRKLFAIFELAWGRTPMPSPWGKTDTNFNYVLHSVGRTPVPQWRGRWRNRFMPYLIYLLWPLRAPLLIWQFTIKYGTAITKLGGPSIFRQILDQLNLAMFKCISPELYYHYRLFEPGRIAQARLFIQANVGSALFSLLNQGDEATIENKLAVEKKLTNHAVPTVATHVIARDGKLEFLNSTNAQLIKGDMVLKPNDGQLGQGIYFVEYVSEANYYKIDNRIVSESQVIEELRKLSTTRTYLLQPCLKNHASILSLAPKSVSTVRLVTGIRSNGKLEKIYATIKIPCNGQLIDNFDAGSLTAAIDIDTGRLGKGIFKNFLEPPVSYTPDSKVKIEGLILPDWERVVDVGLKAHKQFPDFVFLGWDIAITDDGPVILETNGNMGLGIQMPEPCPLGSTVFADIAKEWLSDKHSKIAVAA